MTPRLGLNGPSLPHLGLLSSVEFGTGILPASLTSLLSLIPDPVLKPPSISPIHLINVQIRPQRRDLGNVRTKITRLRKATLKSQYWMASGGTARNNRNSMPDSTFGNTWQVVGLDQIGEGCCGMSCSPLSDRMGTERRVCITISACFFSKAKSRSAKRKTWKTLSVSGRATLTFIARGKANSLKTSQPGP